jgi:hypothetical protein
MGKAKRLRQQRRAAPPPVGKQQQRPAGVWVGIATALLASAALVTFLTTGSHSGASASATPRPIDTRLARVQTGPAPWQPEYGGLADRLVPLGLDALSQAGTVEHIHAHLDLFVNGKRVTVPAQIGINDGAFITELHTHDPSGVMHIESPTKQTFTLGQFFGVWGVRLTSRCLGRYCARPSASLRLYRNGKLQRTPPWRLPLHAHDEIALVYGPAPKKIPVSYVFPSGE